jgi:hypothetical protein
MSKVSFLDTDITGIRISDRTMWGGNDKFKVMEEKWFEQDFKRPIEKRRGSLGGVLSIFQLDNEII